MKIIYGLIYQMDKTMQFLYLFYVSAIIVLIVLHHFLKKHIRLWAGLCCVPLLFFGLFLLKEGYRGDAELTIMRYVAYGIVSLLIALWGLAMLLKRSFKAYTIILSVTTVIILFLSILSIWAVWLRPNVTNYSHYGWTESFEGAIDTMEKYYVLNEWKDIDYDKIRNELIPKVKDAEKRGDELDYIIALYELKYEFGDGHVTVRGNSGKRDAAMERYAGNDYGFSLFRTEEGQIIAICVDKEADCYKKGIHNGTVITKWNGVPVNQAADKVKCLDRNYSFQTKENIYIAQPIFLAGQGGNRLSVGYINDMGHEETAMLDGRGEYIDRRTEVLRTLFGDNVILGDNYSTRMLDEKVGYLRVNEEEYSTDPMFVARSTISGFSQEMYDDLDRRLSEMRKNGMDRIIIDVRNNDGGNGFESRTIASLFTANPLSYNLAIYKDGDYKVLIRAKHENRAKYNDIPIVVLVNGQTCSAGEEIVHYLKGSPNVTVIGNTGTWGNAQGTGGSVVLSDSKYELRFPITPTVDDSNLPIVDTKGNRVSRLKLDHQITYTKEEAIEFFEHPNDDMVLDEAIEYIKQQ